MFQIKDPKNLIFLEVEVEDEPKIKVAFPDAQIVTKMLGEDEIIARFSQAEILCTFIYSKITEKVIQALPNLKLIVTRSVGYDHINLAAAAKRNILVCNVPDYGAHVIAEHVFALLLSSIRFIKEGDNRVELRYFDFHGLRGIALKGKTMGIFGTGKIGKNVARIASLGFLMDVIAYDPFPDEDAARDHHFRYVSQEEVLEKSDIITLHVPFLKSTEHMINRDSIAKMKNGVVLVNTARGGLIETEALVEALRSKKIAYAALDVLEHEDNIAQNDELVRLPNVIITPHIAFYADDTMKKMYSESLESIQEFLSGAKLKHQVLGI